MAVTEEETKLARAYNAGYALSYYEPKLLNKIIKSNGKNEFVQAMRTARDHREFHANIPKAYTPQFKNGYYNGRALLENDPGVFAHTLTSKGLSKEYKNGMAAAKKEYDIQQVQQKMQKEKREAERPAMTSVNFEKGFNVGYRLSKNHRDIARKAIDTNSQYSQFMTGLKQGLDQYQADLKDGKVKNINSSIGVDSLKHQKNKKLQATVDKLVAQASKQVRVMNNERNNLNTMPQKAETKTPAPTKSKSKGKNKGWDLER